MKKQFLLCLILLVSLPFISCNNKGSSGSGEAYTLKMRLAPGDSFKQDMDVEMEMVMEAEGQKINTNMDVEGLLAFSVSPDSGNLKRLTMTYDDIKMRMKTAGIPGAGNINMDSIMDQAASKIKGKTVSMLLNEKNEVVDVVGFSDLMVTEDVDMRTREQIKQMFSKEQMNSMLGMMFQMYPDKPVKVGETWEKEIGTSVASVNMKVKGKYTLKSVKDGVANIDVKGDISGKGSMAQSGANVGDLDMSGSQDGRISIGLEDGYLKDSDYKMDMKAEVTIMGTKVPMNIKAKYLMKGQ